MSENVHKLKLSTPLSQGKWLGLQFSNPTGLDGKDHGF